MSELGGKFRRSFHRKKKKYGAEERERFHDCTSNQSQTQVADQAPSKTDKKGKGIGIMKRLLNKIGKGRPKEKHEKEVEEPAVFARDSMSYGGKLCPTIANETVEDAPSQPKTGTMHGKTQIPQLVTRIRTPSPLRRSNGSKANSVPIPGNQMEPHDRQAGSDRSERNSPEVLNSGNSTPPPRQSRRSQFEKQRQMASSPLPRQLQYKQESAKVKCLPTEKLTLCPAAKPRKDTDELNSQALKLPLFDEDHSNRRKTDSGTTPGFLLENVPPDKDQAVYVSPGQVSGDKETDPPTFNIQPSTTAKNDHEDERTVPYQNKTKDCSKDSPDLPSAFRLLLEAPLPARPWHPGSKSPINRSPSFKRVPRPVEKPAQYPGGARTTSPVPVPVSVPHQPSVIHYHVTIQNIEGLEISVEDKSPITEPQCNITSLTNFTPKTLHTADGRELKRLSWIEVSPAAEKELAQIADAQTQILGEDHCRSSSIEIGSLSFEISQRKDLGEGGHKSADGPEVPKVVGKSMKLPLDSPLSSACPLKALKLKSDTCKDYGEWKVVKSEKVSGEKKEKESSAQSSKLWQRCMKNDLSTSPMNRVTKQSCDNQSNTGFPCHSSTNIKHHTDSKSSPLSNLNYVEKSAHAENTSVLENDDNEASINDTKEESQTKNHRRKILQKQTSLVPRPSFKPGEKKREAEVRENRRRRRINTSPSQSQTVRTNVQNYDCTNTNKDNTVYIDCKKGFKLIDNYKSKGKVKLSRHVEGESQTDSVTDLGNVNNVENHFLCSNCKKLRSKHVSKGSCGHTIPQDIVAKRKADFEHIYKEFKGEDDRVGEDSISAMRVGPTTTYFKHAGCQTVEELKVDSLHESNDKPDRSRPIGRVAPTIRRSASVHSPLSSPDRHMRPSLHRHWSFSSVDSDPVSMAADLHDDTIPALHIDWEVSSIDTDLLTMETDRTLMETERTLREVEMSILESRRASRALQRARMELDSSRTLARERALSLDRALASRDASTSGREPQIIASTESPRLLETRMGETNGQPTQLRVSSNVRRETANDKLSRIRGNLIRVPGVLLLGLREDKINVTMSPDRPNFEPIYRFMRENNVNMTEYECSVLSHRYRNNGRNISLIHQQFRSPLMVR